MLKNQLLVVQKFFQWEGRDPNWILEHSLSFHKLFKNHAKFQNLIKIKLIGDILITIAICDQHGATSTLSQACKPSAHGNACYHKLVKLEAILRNGGSF